MKEAIDNPELVKTMGKAAREFALDKLDWDKIADEFIELFRSRQIEHPLGEGADRTRAAVLNQWTGLV